MSTFLDDLIDSFRANVYADKPCTLTFDGDKVKLESESGQTGDSQIKVVKADNLPAAPKKKIISK